MRNRLLEPFFIRASVGTVAPHGRFRRLRLHAPQLKTVSWTPGQQIGVDCGPKTALTPLLRTYSVWDHDDDWIDLYCLVHGDGPGSVWADTVSAGDTVLISKPKGDFITRAASYHLFVGDETASAAFAPMIRALPDGVVAQSVVQCGDPADRLPVPGAVEWTSDLPVSVGALDVPSDGVAYLAGEARAIQAVRTVLIDRHGWDRRLIRTKPFWTPGKRGME